MAFYCPSEWSPTSSVGLRKNKQTNKNLILKIINHLKFCQPGWLHLCLFLPHLRTSTHKGTWLDHGGRTALHPSVCPLHYLLSVSYAGKETSRWPESLRPAPAELHPPCTLTGSHTSLLFKKIQRLRPLVSCSLGTSAHLSPGIRTSASHTGECLVKYFLKYIVHNRSPFPA